jgi:hypothetical protein
MKADVTWCVYSLGAASQDATVPVGARPATVRTTTTKKKRPEEDAD